MSDFYVTTPIYYVNDLPHVGHIYSTIVGDTIARYRRLRGDRVRFLTGTDEHGQKIERAAEEQGLKPIALADRVVDRYFELWRQMGMSHDDFIRTTEARHAPGVSEIIRRIADSGDFYVDRHEGLYCPLCELFYTEKELDENGNCPIHGTPVELRSEENVFFRLSKYGDALLAHYDANPNFVRPQSRLNEVRQFVAQGLRDLSVSRTSVDWALPFPGYDGHTVYVWLDALTNYISALGFGRDDASLYDTFWAGQGESVHIVGKDILRFHAVYWPAFLLSAGLPLPDTVWAHGWWLRDDKKVSKSVGNVVRPDELMESFGVDALRYFVLRDMVFGQDASFSDEAFVDRYNADLANDLGNTVSRLVTLSRRAFGDRLPPASVSEGPLTGPASEAVEAYHRAMADWAFQDALRALWRLLQETNQYLVRNEPWKKLKDEAAQGEVAEVLWSSLEAVRIVSVGLLPFLPEKAPAVLRTLGAEVPENLGSMAWGGLPAGGELPAVTPLFPRIDKKSYLGPAKQAPKESKPVTETAEKSQAPKKDSAEKEPPKNVGDQAAEPPAERITIDKFFDIQLRVANVVAAEAVPKSKKLLKLTVDVGETEHRTVVAGVAKKYSPEDLVGKQVVVVANLKPAKLMGIESNGMVLAATEDGLPFLVRPESEVPPGTRVS
ncbi:MAG: methionine--tRNA ligase [Acidobacteriota bacterium]